jgi:uncharacterized iron-regulated protein
MSSARAAAPEPDRRAAYLSVTSGLLVTHLGQVHDAWAPGAAYRAAFEATPEASFAKILTGMIVLSGFETGGERLQAALDSGRPGGRALLLLRQHTPRHGAGRARRAERLGGRYTGTDGSTVSGVGRQGASWRRSTRRSRPDRRADRESLTLAKALQPPFDQEIAPGNAAGNARVQALVSLARLEELLFEVFTAFELTVEIPE